MKMLQKVALLALSCNRLELMQKTWANNFRNAGIPFSLFVFDNGSAPEVRDWINTQHPYRRWFPEENLGIARAQNEMLFEAMNEGFTHFCFMANDILEPDEWLKDRVLGLKYKTNAGMVSQAVDAGHPTYENCDIIGQYMITRQVVEEVGYFTEEYGLYGPIDLDYNYRVRAAGLATFYIPGKAEHIGPHGEQAPDEYGYSKAELVQKAWPKLAMNQAKYAADPYVPYIIYENQFP